MPVTRADQVNASFVEAMNAGDLDRALEIWSPQTVFVTQPGNEAVRGTAALREALQAFLDLKPTLRFESLQFIEADDIAFESIKWTLEGTGPDGEPVRMVAIDGNVLRRLDDGRWVTVIDNPFHSEHIGLAVE
jgi:uncharacterized protein (TIGR02246 family)